MIDANRVSFPIPDWVMCGVQNPPGVRLLASQDLTQAELEAQIDRPDIFHDDPLFMIRQRFFLTAEMRTFTIIDAPDYPTAFKSLFEHWTPKAAARPALGEGSAGARPVTALGPARPPFPWRAAGPSACAGRTRRKVLTTITQTAQPRFEGSA